MRTRSSFQSFSINSVKWNVAGLTNIDSSTPLYAGAIQAIQTPNLVILSAHKTSKHNSSGFVWIESMFFYFNHFLSCLLLINTGQIHLWSGYSWTMKWVNWSWDEMTSSWKPSPSEEASADVKTDSPKDFTLSTNVRLDANGIDMKCEYCNLGLWIDCQ
jgi:hypothetical protein